MKKLKLDDETLSLAKELASELNKHRGEDYKAWYQRLMEFKEGFTAGAKSVESRGDINGNG